MTPLLPPLREELRLLPAAANGDGSPAWMIHDPVCNRFFRIGWLDFEMLARWDLGSPAAVVESIQSETTLLPNTGDLQALTAFLERHSLLRIATQAGVRSLTERAARQQHAPLTWLLHHYLFFRLPLARPQGWLGRVAQRLDWLYRPGTAILIALLSLVGLLLAGRQWDSFRTSFVDNLTTGGLIGFALALTCAKALHEFGHALTATRYGVRVAHMGVAMVVLWPMLYTDTSESWKLANPRQRLAIASAGIVAELALAGLATLAWSLVPDGPLRSALFFLATTSWVLTLAVNASPFMRFDGYFILADLLDMPNLHERAGHLARTWLRRHLAGLDEPWPERLPPGQHAGLIAFALVTWVYRLGVFIGIAVAVYYMFFKALGILLFLVEIGWFVLRPLIVEMREWRSRRNDIPVSRKRGALIAALILILAGLIPWPGSLSGAGWLHAERQHTVHAPLAGRVVRLAGSGPVDAGQLLVEVESPELLLSARRADGQRESSERELAGLSGLPDGEQRRAQIQGQHDKYAAEAGAFRDEAARLQLLAPFKGQLVDVDPSLAAGVWVAPRQALGMVIDPTGWVVEAFIPEADVGRVRPGDAARFHPTGQPFGILEGKVIEVDSTRSATLPHPALDAAAGGPIATLPNQQQSPTPGRSPRESLYRVRIVVNGSPALPRIAIGEVRIAGEGRAWLPAAVNRILAVGVRELGF